jgi:hypothetical protein
LVADSGAPLGAGDMQQWRVTSALVDGSAGPEIVLGAIHAPQAVVVQTDRAGWPVMVQRPDWPRPRRVVGQLDRWRIDDEWWRERSVSRLYYALQLDDGATLTVYQDLVDGAWRLQRYSAPRRPVRRWKPRSARQTGFDGERVA